MHDVGVHDELDIERFGIAVRELALDQNGKVCAANAMVDGDGAGDLLEVLQGTEDERRLGQADVAPGQVRQRGTRRQHI